MADGKYIPVYYEADGTTKNAFLVRDLDEKMIKELRLDEVMSFYDQCLKDNGGEFNKQVQFYGMFS